MKFVPTIRMILEAYPKIAAVERMRMERPCEKSVASVVSGVRRLCEIGEISLDEPMSVFTRRRLEQVFDASLASELKPISVWSYLYSLRKLFARWTQRYYTDRKWVIPQLEIPSCQRQAPRYIRPDTATLAKVKEWYFGLEGELWLMATMMLEFAMRNGDVLRLSEDNFIEKGGRIYLCYTPHKTELTSSRHVLWPVHPEIWNKIEEYGGIRCFDISQEYFVEMNRQLREIGFNGSKASYELRKICIDHIYQKFGAEMATSISGDDIKTITRYYADPSQPNIGEVRVVDLF